MKKIRLVISVLFVIWAWTAVSAAEYDLNELFPLPDKSKWIYSVSKNSGEKEKKRTDIMEVRGKELIGSSLATKVFIQRDDGKEKETHYQYIVIDAEGVKILRIFSEDSKSYKQYSPALVLFPAGIQPRKYLHQTVEVYSYDLTGNLLKRKRIIRTTTFLGIEDIIFGSRKFERCAHFNISESDITPGDSEESQWEVWLAPKIGKVREIKTSKRDSDNFGVISESSTAELSKFENEQGKIPRAFTNIRG